MDDNDRAISLAQNIYQDINEWLKFAEAKHAALLAAWIALWIGIISLEIENSYVIVQQVALFFIALCASINFLSFFPFLNKSDIIKKLCLKEYDAAPDNILFYISIFIQSADQNVYKTNFMNSLGGTNISSSGLLDHYLNQIIDVSTVATIKVYLFAISLKLAAASLIVVSFFWVIA